MTEMIQIACAACGYGAEVALPEGATPEALQCPMCGTWIRDYAAEIAAANEMVGPTVPEAASELESEPIRAAADAVEHHAANIAACLVESDSKDLEKQYPLTAEKTVVGRDHCDITIYDPTMSIRHFEIELENGEFVIRDLGSTNHTRVNGKKIEVATLRNGDRIQAGLSSFVFLAG